MKTFKVDHFNLSQSNAPFIALQDKPVYINDQYEQAEFSFDKNGILYIKAMKRIMRSEPIKETIKKYLRIDGKLKRKDRLNIGIKKSFVHGFIIPERTMKFMVERLGFIHTEKLRTVDGKKVYTFADESRVCPDYTYYVKELKPVEFMFTNYRISDDREKKSIIPLKRTFI